MIPAPHSLLRLHEADNVGVCCRDIEQGERLLIAQIELVAGEPVGLGHKLALRTLAIGEKVVKYGMPIGSVTRAIPAGGWVHIHNMIGDFLPAHHRGEGGRP
jgi:hypothetical protein